MQNHKETREAFGSIFILELSSYSDILHLSQLVENYWSIVDDFESKYSRFKIGNELDLLNSNTGKWVKVSKELFDLVKTAYDFKKETDGYFDISVESILVKLGYDKDYSFVEKPFLSSGTGDFLYRDPNLVKISQRIEFGGFGKGLMLDKGKDIFKSVDSVFINAGGDMYCKNTDTKILFENPFDIKQAIGFAFFDEKFLVSSSDNRRNWKKYSHLINPYLKNSFSDLAGVYVQGLSGARTDAISTSLFVMGYDRAKYFLNKERDYEVMLIKNSGEMYLTDNFVIEFF